MPTSRAATGRWTAVAVVLSLYLGGTPALAQNLPRMESGVPNATIQRIAEIDVQLAEIEYLADTYQIDGQAVRERRPPLEKELAGLRQELGKFPPDEQRRAAQEIQGLTSARLATLMPQWQKQAQDLKTAREQRDKASFAAVPDAARAALEPQRRRLILQQRRDRKEITAEEFAARDKEALDEITAIRKKYVADYGPRFIEHFDSQLRLLTQALGNNPAASIPTSQVPAGRGGTSDADYQKDVALAADLLVKLTDLHRQFVPNSQDSAQHRETTKILETDLARLTLKWRAGGRGTEFEQEYQKPPARPTQVRRVERVDNEVPIGAALGALLILVVVIGGGVFVYKRFFEWDDGPINIPGPSGTYGTARWADAVTRVHDKACVAKGVFLGKGSCPAWYGHPLSIIGAPVCSTPETHTLIVAPTRSGKGTRVIIPTLLRYAGSTLVLDPKGENAAVTARTRRDQVGQDIHIVNPWNEQGQTFARMGFSSATYNPLDIIERNDPNSVGIAQALAGAICPTSHNGKDRFWEGSAAGVMAAVFLWLADQPVEKKTLARAREIVTLSRPDFTVYLTKMAASKAFDGAVREMTAPLIGMAQETYSGIMAALSQDTRWLSDPQIKTATAASSFSMSELITGKTTVYLVIPFDNIDTQKTWLRLVLAAAMHTFKRFPFDQRPGHRCLFLIDEFGSIGRLDDLPRDIATMSGYGVDFALILQGLDQLKDHYGEARGTILSNCAWKWFSAVEDLDTAKWLSEILGKATVMTESTTSSTSENSGNSGRSESTNRGETGRWLINPDEIRLLGNNVAIVLPPSGQPHYLRPVDYWDLQQAFWRLEEKNPRLFWYPPVKYDLNPTRPNSA